MSAILIAQIGRGSFDVGKAIGMLIVYTCLWSSLATFVLIGTVWAASAIARRRYPLREMLAFVRYWAAISACAAGVLNCALNW